MAENLAQPKTGSRHPATPDIPWMRRWETKTTPETGRPADTGKSILSDIEFMSMLEELEYR